MTFILIAMILTFFIVLCSLLRIFSKPPKYRYVNFDDYKEFELKEFNIKNDYKEM